MINNVALLISGTLHGQDTRELLERCHPLGTFEIIPVLWIATSVEELYSSVLVETPSEPYFKNILPSADPEELNIQIIRNTAFLGHIRNDSTSKGWRTSSLLSKHVANSPILPFLL